MFEIKCPTMFGFPRNKKIKQQEPAVLKLFNCPRNKFATNRKNALFDIGTETKVVDPKSSRRNFEIGTQIKNEYLKF